MIDEGASPVKGILIAERPGGLKAGEQPAFVPAGIHEPWGLNPTRKVVEVAREYPPSVNEHHRLWIKHYEEEMRLKKEQQELEAAKAANKKQTLAEFSTRLRTTVLQGGDVTFWKATQAFGSGSLHSINASNSLPATQQPQQQQQQVSAPDAAVERPKADEPMPCIIESAQIQQPSTPCPSAAPAPLLAANTTEIRPSTGRGTSTRSSQQGKHKSKVPLKPVWALSTEEADKAQEDEVDELMDFAESLDYDSFVAALDDPQLKETLQELQQAETAGHGNDDEEWRKQFVKAMNHVSSQRQKDHGRTWGTSGGGGASGVSRPTTSCTHRTEGASHGIENRTAHHESKAQGWDASSACAKDTGHMQEVYEGNARAEDFLRENPDMKNVYSTASVRAVLSKVDMVS